MTENRYTSIRYIDGKVRNVIVDETGKIINRNPSKDELKELEIYVNIKYSDEYLLDSLITFRKEKGRNPTYRDIAHSSTMVRRFGSWNNSLKLADLDTRDSKNRYSNEELLNIMRTFREEKGRNPTTDDFIHNPKYPSFTTYQSHFGSWKDALIKAGLDITEKRRPIYTHEELMNYLHDYHKKNGKVPTKADFYNNPDYPSYGPYIFRYGSWSNALKEAKLDLDTMIQNGHIETNIQKGRNAEIIIRDSFEKESIDLAGENCKSPYDGICPNYQTYEVKSAGLTTRPGRDPYFDFNTRSELLPPKGGSF